MNTILNFGSLNIDYVYRVPHFVRPGETLDSKELQIHCGGKGLNQSIALASAGLSVRHAGKIGPDGALLLAELERYGVDTSLTARSDQRTGHAIIQVDATGQNSILLHGGANRTLTEADVDAALAQMAPGDWVLVQNETNNIAYILRQAKARGLRLAMNPSPISESLMTAPLELVDLFVLNEVEAEALTCANTISEMAARMQRRFSAAQIVLTLGTAGSMYLHGDQHYQAGIFEVDVVDTTAAGDTFLGFFIGSLIHGGDPAEALRLAAAASALAVSRAGAASSIPTRAEAVRAMQTLPQIVFRA